MLYCRLLITIFFFHLFDSDLDFKIAQSLSNLNMEQERMATNIHVLSDYIIKDILADSSPFVMSGKLKEAFQKIKLHDADDPQQMEIASKEGYLTLCLNQTKLEKMIDAYHLARNQVGDQRKNRINPGIYQVEFTLDTLVHHLFTKSPWLEGVKRYLCANILPGIGHVQNMNETFGKPNTYDYLEISGDGDVGTQPALEEKE
jgi:hypothetical protein